MLPTVRFALILLLFALVTLGVSPVALAGTDVVDDDAPVADTSLVPVEGEVPAVEAPPAEVQSEEDPWTSRFLVPTVMLLGIAALVGSIGYYGVRVRGRYRVMR